MRFRRLVVLVATAGVTIGCAGDADEGATTTTVTEASTTDADFCSAYADMLEAQQQWSVEYLVSLDEDEAAANRAEQEAAAAPVEAALPQEFREAWDELGAVGDRAAALVDALRPTGGTLEPVLAEARRQGFRSVTEMVFADGIEVDGRTWTFDDYRAAGANLDSRIAARCGGDDDLQQSVGLPLEDALQAPPDQDFEHFVGPNRGEPGLPFRAGTIIEGGRVIDDTQQSDGIASRAIEAAACRNYRDWLLDVTLNTRIAILSDDGLYRSAELLDGPYHDDDTALAAEAVLVAGASTEGVLDQLRTAGATAAELVTAEEYLNDRAQPPSPNVRDSYVVYAASVTTLTVDIVRLAIGEVTLVEPTPNRAGDISVVVSPSMEIAVPETACWL